MSRRKIAVIGHVEHVTLGSVSEVPKAGEIAHMQNTRVMPGGGGGIAFAQLVRSDAEVHLFTALGNDEGGAWVRAQLLRVREHVHIHAAQRDEPHPRVVVMVDGGAKRTIVVTHEPLQPRASDALPWSTLATFDAVYFTGSHPDTLVLARAARILLATARRRPALDAARIAVDVVVGSVSDPRENAPLEAYAVTPAALVLTDGPRPIRVVRAAGETRVEPPARVDTVRGDYGAGDSFAAALTYFVACDVALEDAVKAAGPYGAAVLAGIDPRDGQALLTRP